MSFTEILVRVTRADNLLFPDMTLQKVTFLTTLLGTFIYEKFMIKEARWKLSAVVGDYNITVQLILDFIGGITKLVMTTKLMLWHIIKQVAVLKPAAKV